MWHDYAAGSASLQQRRFSIGLRIVVRGKLTVELDSMSQRRFPSVMMRH